MDQAPDADTPSPRLVMMLTALAGVLVLFAILIVAIEVRAHLDNLRINRITAFEVEEMRKAEPTKTVPDSVSALIKPGGDFGMEERGIISENAMNPEKLKGCDVVGNKIVCVKR